MATATVPLTWKLQEDALTAQDIERLTAFLQTTNRYTQFTEVHRFEEAFAAWNGSKYAVFVNSGSSANLLLIAAMKELRAWERGDEVIVPAVTWPTTVTPIIQLGLRPVFVDCNLSDLAVDYEQVAARLTKRTRAIFVAHLLGFPADVARLKKLIAGRDIDLLEDCCESQGAHVDGRKVGTFGQAGTFSFYYGHHMTTVEGGMLVTDNPDLYRLALLKRSHGLARELPPEDHGPIAADYPSIDFRFLFLTDGYNFRNTEIGAVLGLSQLEHIDAVIERRNRNYDLFLDICREYPDDLMAVDVPGRSSFVFPFLCRNADKRRWLQTALAEAGIESRPLVSGNLLKQPFLHWYYQAALFKNADFIHDHACYIGNHPHVTAARLVRLAEIVHGVLR